MKKRIMIVEDEKIIAEDVKRTLLSFDYDVIGIVSSGEVAVEIAQQEKPDLILMDVMLSGDMNGLDAADHIYNVYDIPVIFLTAYANDEILSKATLSSPFGYLIKPFEDRELKVNLDMAFYKHQMEKNLRNSRNFLMNLIDTVPNYISVKDENFKYIIANKAYADLYKTTPKSMVGKTDSDFIDSVIKDKDLVAKYHQNDLEVLENKQPKFIPEEYYENVDGITKWFQTTKVPMKSIDNKDVVLTVAVDITKRKETEDELEESYHKLQLLMEETVNGLVFALEKRDPYTAGHQRRVAILATKIAEEMRLPKDQINGLRIAALVHDIGKIYVPSEILSKPGKLTTAEMNLIKTHPQAGFDILSKIQFPWPVADIVIQHQERLDGNGYPAGLKGDEIILEARIISVADVVEAIASHRPYRAALGLDFAIKEISSNRGVLYDAAVVDACLNVVKDEKFVFEDSNSKLIEEDQS
ncbi:MAG: response regulator [Candidatus Cloacimonetes bacterium]|nr:response regulator [Candidatus Cloacimonadota bacterium]MCF7813548.1 response regulator [Candidatus Cloacimonadota bacterium]MCF7869289.1 response regulator [Candidatus Cloacimonadota bacterium]MCF7884202.1 response regulator [Candidatus Cloacimonadota bacterium]